MELHEYWQIAWKRRALIVPLAVVTFVASVLFNLVLPPTYKTETTVYVQAVIPPPAPGVPEYYSTEYYRTVYSEYLADDLGVIVKSRDFAEKMAGRIRSRYGLELPVKDIQDSIANARKTHRTLKITIATGQEALTRQLGEAMDEVLRTDGWRYFNRDERQPISINVVDPPRDPTSPSVFRRLVDVLLHTSVALIVGLGLAFGLHYLDDRVRDEDDARRTLDWPVLGAIPSESVTLDGRLEGIAPVWRLPGLRALRKISTA